MTRVTMAKLKSVCRVYNSTLLKKRPFGVQVIRHENGTDFVLYTQARKPGSYYLGQVLHTGSARETMAVLRSIETLVHVMEVGQ